MPSRIQQLQKRGLINQPNWLIAGLCYETLVGSVSFGTSQDSSDEDIYAITIPSKETVFPYLTGAIPGFGKQPPKFDQYQQHHIEDQSGNGGKGKIYDVTCYNIVRYFSLLMENNPNIIDSIYTPINCVTHSTVIGEMIRSNREIFLHKGCFVKLKAYSFSQLHKMRGKNPIGKRVAIRERYGYDTKFASNVVRLLDECEQILLTGELDLQKNKEHIKAIRRGEVPEEEIIAWAQEKERQLEKIFVESKLRDKPDEEKIKQLLLNCLETYWGSLPPLPKTRTNAEVMLEHIREFINKYDAGKV